MTKIVPSVKDKEGVVTPLTDWFFAPTVLVGWGIGLRVLKYRGKTKREQEPKIQIQKWRTNKERRWVPTKSRLTVNFKQAKELFGGDSCVLVKCLEEYARTKLE